MDRLTDEALDELAEMEREAIPAPWTAEPCAGDDVITATLSPADGRPRVFYESYAPVETDRFVAALRNAARSLLSEVRASRAAAPTGDPDERPRPAPVEQEWRCPVCGCAGWSLRPGHFQRCTDKFCARSSERVPVEVRPGSAAREDGASPGEIALAFHLAYEALAPSFGYRTREASAKPWSEVPQANRDLMVATVRAVLFERGGPFFVVAPAPGAAPAMASADDASPGETEP